jgi:hypothetical protein
MGNFFNKAKAKVTVTFDSTIILPGEILNGKINIQPNKNTEVTQLQNPKIELAILQEINWQSFIFSEEDKTTRNGDGESNVNYFSNQTLNCTQFKGKNFSDGITIPFQYKVPEDITPSLEWPHTRYEFASIRNFLVVNIPELKYKKKILIIILKKPKYIDGPLKMTVFEERKKLLLFGNGSIKVEALAPQNSFPILGTIPLTVTVDASKSDVLIKGVTVKLKRKLHFFSKNNIKSTRNIIQNMYEEKKKVCSKKEELLFNIPFKDSKEIEYYMKSSPLGEDTEICCLIPNVSINTITVIYYIKIIADPDDLLAKRIELKLNIDFHSKSENQKNNNIYDNFNKQINKINSGAVNINYTEPYLQYQNINNDKPYNPDIYSYQYSIDNQNQNNYNYNQIQNQNYEQYNYNNNPYNSNYAPPPPNYIGYQNNNYYPNYQNMNNNMNQINNNQNMNNDKNNRINNNNNNQNSVYFPAPPKNNEEDDDLPTLDEIEKNNKQKEKEKEKEVINNAYPEF